MHEENFWSNWVREDERGKEERTAKAENSEEEKGEKRKREEEKEANETEAVKRRCDGLEAFEIFAQGRDVESDEDLSWEDPLDEFKSWSGCELDSRASVRVVLDVTDVLVPRLRWSPSCVVLPPVVLTGIWWNLFFLQKAVLDSHA